MVIPKGVETIYDSAFENNQLTSVVIPNSVTRIGDGAFANNRLTSVVIPNSVTRMGGGVFNGNELTSVSIWAKVNIKDSVYTLDRWILFENFFNNHACHIGTYVYHRYGWVQEKDMVIPNSFTTIDNDAFRGNELTSVVIPNSVTTIGSSAFKNNRLTSVVIPNSVTTIGDGAFADNPLTSITIGANVKLEKDAFPNGFVNFYEKQKKRAGTYIYRSKKWRLKK